MIELNKLQARVLTVIWRNGPLTPSQIGLHMEFKFDEASQRVTRPIKFLQEKGLIVREARNARVVKYRTPSDTLPPIRLKKDDEGGTMLQKVIHENS